MRKSPNTVLLACFLPMILLAFSPAAGQDKPAPPAAAPDASLPAEFQHQRQFELPAALRPAASPAEPVFPPLRMVVENGQIRPKALLLQDGIEGTFPGANWNLFNLGSAAGWGKSGFRKSQGNSSAWCAQSGATAPGAGQDVPANMDSWMVSGPYNLSAIRSGSFSFDLWLETEDGFDIFYAAASLNGTNYTALGRETDTNGFQRFSINLKTWGNLGDLTGKNAVYFAFLYRTDGSVGYEGAYVDQVALDASTGNGLNLLINQIDAASCPTLRAFVSVTDSLGNPITGLQTSSFTISDGGSLPPVTSQPATGSGAALASTLVLDGSGSLSNADVANIKVAAKAFIDLLQPVDSVAVYHFGSDVDLIQDYTASRPAARAAVDALTNNLGSTSLYDAIVEAANHSLVVGGRRALVVMTDGMNNDSAANEQQAIAAAVAAGVPVFTIGFGNVDEDVLQRIADQTGGLFFLGASSADLQMIFARIGATLGSQYLLTWPAAVVNGGTHSVTVEVRHQGDTAIRTVNYNQAGTPCATATPCVEGPTTLCLNQNRFKVEVRWTDFNQQSGSARVAPCGSDDSGILYFFSPDNWEMLVKVLNACAINQRFWVYAAATTDVGYTVTVTDTRNGTAKTYTNRVGNAAAAITDSQAFATCP
jgi:VWFA-related protein